MHAVTIHPGRLLHVVCAALVALGVCVGLSGQAVAQLTDMVDWQQHNQRRIALIHKSVTTSLSREETAELERLQAALDQRLASMDDQLLAVVASMQQAVETLPDATQS